MKPSHISLKLKDQASPSETSLSHLIVHLLKGPIYSDVKPKLWSALLDQRQQVRDYLLVINLALFFDEAEGYAFLRQIESENSEEPLPRLITRRPLGFAMSVLCILLRRWLSEHDTKAGEIRAIIERSMIHQELELYLPELRNEAKSSDKIDKHIDQAIELGLVRILKGDREKLEILRITKALINAEWLGDLNNRMRQYKQHAGLILEDGDDV